MKNEFKQAEDENVNSGLEKNSFRLLKIMVIFFVTFVVIVSGLYFFYSDNYYISHSLAEVPQVAEVDKGGGRANKPEELIVAANSEKADVSCELVLYDNIAFEKYIEGEMYIIYNGKNLGRGYGPILSGDNIAFYRGVGNEKHIIYNEKDLGLG